MTDTEGWSIFYSLIYTFMAPFYASTYICVSSLKQTSTHLNYRVVLKWLQAECSCIFNKHGRCLN